MAKKNSEDLTNNEIFESLIAGTDFQLGEDMEVLSARGKVGTPIEALNILLGGGIPFGAILQSYGPPKVGKSTWIYQMMGIFQKQYPNGISVIIDMEASADNSRIAYLGVDLTRVMRLPASSVEAGFLSILKMLENKSKNPQLADLPVFVIWDTISKGLAQDGATQSRMNAMDRARIIKNYMSPVLAEIEKHDFILALLNQVIYKTDNYGNQKMDSGGGIALKHDVHFSTRIVSGSDTTEGSFLVRRTSRMDIDKSKISPEIYNIPIILDVTKGGKIDERLSFLEYLLWSEFIKNKSGWYKWDDELPNMEMNPYYYLFCEFSKSYRYGDIADAFTNSNELYLAWCYYYATFLQGLYSLQSESIEPYRIQIADKLSEYYYPIQIQSELDEKFREKLVDKIKKIPDLLDVVEEAKNTGYRAINVNTYELENSLYDGENVISIDYLTTLVDPNELLPEVSVSSDSNNTPESESTEESPEVIG